MALPSHTSSQDSSILQYPQLGHPNHTQVRPYPTSWLEPDTRPMLTACRSALQGLPLDQGTQPQGCLLRAVSSRS